MKNLIASIAFATVFVGVLAAQQQPLTPISNVKIRVNEEQDKVTITYDLARRPNTLYFSIKINLFLDGEPVHARGLAGDIGPQVQAGLGKKVVWDVHQDVSELAGELKVDVSTDTKLPNNGGPCMPIKTIPVYAGLGGAALTSVGLLIGGLALENESKPMYDLYKNHVDPNDPVYSELSRQEAYNEANSKHKQGSLLMIAGGATLAIGGALLINRLVKINKYNNNCAGKMSAVPTYFDFKPAVLAGGGPMPATGFALVFHF